MEINEVLKKVTVFYKIMSDIFSLKSNGGKIDVICEQDKKRELYINL